jgi:hypothetical protein
MAPTSEHNRCPVCRTPLAASFAEPITERQCPRCEAFLWALALPSGPAFFIRRPHQSAGDFLAALAGPAIDASARDIDSFLRGADSFDIVEFFEELEAASESPGGRRDSD